MKNIISILGLSVFPFCAFGSPPNDPVVTVGGQVRRPGPVPFQKALTIYAAIQAAGRPTEFGSMRRVKLIHGKNIFPIDFTKDEAKTILVSKDDTIEVPQKNLLGR